MSRWVKSFKGAAAAMASRGVVSVRAASSLETTLPKNQAPLPKKRFKSSTLQIFDGEKYKTVFKAFDSLPKEKKTQLFDAFPDPADDFAVAVADLLRRNIINEELLHRMEAYLKSKMNPPSHPAKALVRQPYFGQAIVIQGKKVLSAHKQAERSRLVFTPGLGEAYSLNGLEKNHTLMTRLFPGMDAMEVFVPSNESRYDPADYRTQERYFCGMKIYFEGEKFFNAKDSYEFFEQVLRPRFFDAEGKLKAPESCDRLLLVSHSIGVRETISHIRYFIEMLRTQGLNEWEIEKYTSKILRLNIGSPVIEGHEKLTPAIDIYGLDDSRSLKNPYTMVKICLNPAVQKEKVFRGKEGNYLTCVFGYGVVQDDNPRDGSCHSLECYSEAMQRELKPVIDVCTKFADPEISDKEAFETYQILLDKTTAFETPDISKITLEGPLRTLYDAWYQRSLYLAQLRFKEKSKAPSSQPETIEAIRLKPRLEIEI